MKKSIPYILTAVLLLAAASTTHAQEKNRAYRYGPASANQAVYYQPYWTVDWLPDPGTELHDNIASRQIRRYTVAVHPFYGLKDGLKLDFEMELARPGTWLQFGLMGYHAGEGGNRGWVRWESTGSRYHGRENLASGYDTFIRMSGAGGSIAYKSMISHGGFYVSAGLLYNYYSVDHDAIRYLPFEQDGLPFYERTPTEANIRFHQPALTVNVGKHFAFGRNVFLDTFVGVGYMHSFYKGPKAYTDRAAFGYRGSYLNGGVRLGVLWR